MSARQSHSGRPVGRMDAPASPGRGGVPNSRPGFVQAPGAADEDWRRKAPCLPWRLKARGIAPKIFFPVSKEDAAGAEVAKQICRLECPVRERCLAFAFESSCSDGIFGGLDPEERRALKRRQARGVTGQNRKYSDETRAEVLAALEAALPDHELVIDRAAYAVGKRFGVDKKTVLRWLDEETAPRGACGPISTPGGPVGAGSAAGAPEAPLRAEVGA